MFAALASVYAALLGSGHRRASGCSPRGIVHSAAAVAVSGLAGVFCSVMIYASTRRPFWNPARHGTQVPLDRPGPRHAASLLLTRARPPASGSLTVADVDGRHTAACSVYALIAASRQCKLLSEAAIFAWLRSSTFTPLQADGDADDRRSVAQSTLQRFAAGHRRRHCVCRRCCWQAAYLHAIAHLTAARSIAVVSTALRLTLAGELLERYLFFAAVVAPRCREHRAMSMHRLDKDRSIARGTTCSISTTGPLTRDLLRNPGGFGLGQVPAGKAPDATTAMICGFCSTGCGLNIHLQERRGDRPDADDRLSRQSRHGLSQGLGSADASSKAADRATTPLLRDDSGQHATR